MRAVAAIAVGVKTSDQFRIAFAKQHPVGIVGEAEHVERLAFARGEAIGSGASRSRPKAGSDRVQWIAEVAPCRSRDPRPGA